MKKYGWNWTSEYAADAYKLILIESGCYDSRFGGSADLAVLLDLADEVVRLEGRIPGSFEVAVDLGSIYSAAAVSNARNVKVCDELIAKAHEAWRIASLRFEKGMPKDAALGKPGPLRAAYIGAYWQIPCEIGFARYIQTGCTDVTHLRALKKFWERAKQERPDHPILQAVGAHIDKKLSPAEQIEQRQALAPAFRPGIEQSRPELPKHGRRALIVGAIVAVTIAVTGLGYVYRKIDGRHVLQQRYAAGSDPGGSVLSETSVAAASNHQQAIAPGDRGDKDPEAVSSAVQPDELPGYGATRTPIVRMKADRPPQPTRKTQRSVPHTASAFSKQRWVEMPSDIDSSDEVFQEPSQPVASSPISPPGATGRRKIEECAPGFAGIICRERNRWERCSGRWGVLGCEVYQRESPTD
jgi:hypothetical protein